MHGSYCRSFPKLLLLFLLSFFGGGGAATDQTGRVARVAFEQAWGSNFLEVPTRPLFLTARRVGLLSPCATFAEPVCICQVLIAVGFPPSPRWRQSLQLAVVVKIAVGAEAYSALTQFFLVSQRGDKTLVCRLVLLLPLPNSGHTQESRARSCAACPGMVDTLEPTTVGTACSKDSNCRCSRHL